MSPRAAIPAPAISAPAIPAPAISARAVAAAPVHAISAPAIPSAAIAAPAVAVPAIPAGAVAAAPVHAISSPAVPARGLLGTRGQASVEFVAIVPLVLLILAAAWQFLLAGDALWHARSAARAAARAQAVGADPAAAARAHLPARLERALRVDEDGGDVRVTLRIPAVISALDPGRVSATGHFAPQS